MQYQSIVFNPRGNYFTYLVFYLLYVTNDLFLGSTKFERLLWDLIKVELFFISGGCKHTGNCCKSVMLYKSGKPLNKRSTFNEALLNNTKYARFKPFYFTNSESIQSFSCKCLSLNNLCTDYSNRPKFCQQYPVSSFIQFDHLLKGCGYSLKRTNIIPFMVNQKFKKRVENVLKLNHF